MAYDFALCSEVIESQITLFTYLCILKPQFFGILFHFLFEEFLNITRISLQYFSCLFYCFLIIFITLFIDTWCTTIM